MTQVLAGRGYSATSRNGSRKCSEYSGDSKRAESRRLWALICDGAFTEFHYQLKVVQDSEVQAWRSFSPPNQKTVGQYRRALRRYEKKQQGTA